MPLLVEEEERRKSQLCGTCLAFKPVSSSSLPPCSLLEILERSSEEDPDSDDDLLFTPCPSSRRHCRRGRRRTQLQSAQLPVPPLPPVFSPVSPAFMKQLSPSQPMKQPSPTQPMKQLSFPQMNSPPGISVGVSHEASSLCFHGGRL